MHLRFQAPLPVHPDTLMRAAGYAPFRDPQSGEESYTRRLMGEYYPRFHCYVLTTDTMVTFNLHLDQKKPSYHGTHAHGGEYDGPTVEAEIHRLRAAFHARLRSRH